MQNVNEISEKELQDGLAKCREQIEEELLAGEWRLLPDKNNSLSSYSCCQLQAALELLKLVPGNKNVYASAVAAIGLLAIRMDAQSRVEEYCEAQQDQDSAITDALVLLARFIEPYGFTVGIGDTVFFACGRCHCNLPDVANVTLRQEDGDCPIKYPAELYGELSFILDARGEKQSAGLARLFIEKVEKLDRNNSRVSSI